MLTVKSNNQIYRSFLKRCLRLFTTGEREIKIKPIYPPTCAYPLRVVCVWKDFLKKDINVTNNKNFLCLVHACSVMADSLQFYGL